MPMVMVFGEQHQELERRGVIVNCAQCTRATSADWCAPAGFLECQAIGGLPVSSAAPRLCTLFEERR